LDTPTRNLRKYVQNKGFNLSEISRKTKIPYMALYDSLMNDKRDRDLRVGEFLALCNHLELNPMDFAEKPEDPEKEVR